MTCYRGIGVCAALLFGVFNQAIAMDPSTTSLLMKSDGDRIILSVPVSKIELSLPRGDFERNVGSGTGSAASPRYFRFDDSKHGIIVSGWFESANQFRGFEEFWKSELQSLKANGVALRDAPDIVRVGPWVATAYDVDVGKLNGANSHLRSELIQAGTWIDLHISVTREGSVDDARKLALSFLKGIVVTERQ